MLREYIARERERVRHLTRSKSSQRESAVAGTTRRLPPLPQPVAYQLKRRLRPVPSVTLLAGTDARTSRRRAVAAELKCRDKRTAGKRVPMRRFIRSR